MMGPISLALDDNPTRSKIIAYDDIKEAFLAKSETSLRFLGKKLGCLYLEDFLKNMNVNCTCSNNWPHHHANLLLPTTHGSIDLTFKLDNDQPSLSLEILDYAIVMFL